jgi:hypothetical protein
MKIWMMPLVLAALFSTNSYAEDLGKEIKVAVLNNQPALYVQFAHDTDTGIEFTLSVLGSDLANGECITSIAYRFYNAATHTYVTDWAIEEYGSDCAIPVGTYPMQMGSSDPVIVKNILTELPNLKMVLSVNFFGTQYKTTNYIDLAAYCVSSPTNFVDLTTSQTGCSVKF